jgi:hypothetical protein
MKNRLMFATLFAALFLLQSTTQAQSADYKNVMSFNLGYSFFNSAAKLAKSNSGSTATASSIPTLQASFDHGFSEWFSLGGALSYNSGTSSDSNFSLIDSTGATQSGSYDLKISRITVTARMLFHYGNTGKLDMYSGIRLGAGIWSTGLTSTIPNLSTTDLPGGGRAKGTGALPTVQFIPFALRGYVTENLGLGFETAIGSPYMACIQLNYRLGGGKN